MGILKARSILFKSFQLAIFLAALIATPDNLLPAWAQTGAQFPKEDTSTPSDTQPGQTGAQTPKTDASTPTETKKGPFNLKGGVVKGDRTPTEVLKAINDAAGKLKHEAKSLFKECTRQNYIEAQSPTITGGFGFVIVDKPDFSYEPGYLPPNENKVASFVASIQKLTDTLEEHVADLALPTDTLANVNPIGRDIKQIMGDLVQHKANLAGLVNAYDLNTNMIVRNAERLIDDSRVIQLECKQAAGALQNSPSYGLAAKSTADSDASAKNHPFSNIRKEAQNIPF
jgi:hypothetical protein